MYEFEKHPKLTEFIQEMANTGRAPREWTSFLYTLNQALRTHDANGSLRFSEREVDLAYLCGVFNASGIDGLYTEIQRLKELGKEPHDIIEACRKQ